MERLLYTFRKYRFGFRQPANLDNSTCGAGTYFFAVRYCYHSHMPYSRPHGYPA